MLFAWAFSSDLEFNCGILFIVHRVSSGGVSSKRSSIDHASKINSVISCGSTETGVSTAGELGSTIIYCINLVIIQSDLS